MRCGCVCSVSVMSFVCVCEGVHSCDMSVVISIVCDMCMYLCLFLHSVLVCYMCMFVMCAVCNVHVCMVFSVVSCEYVYVV